MKLSLLNRTWIKIALVILLGLMAFLSLYKGIVNGLDGERIDFQYQGFVNVIFMHDNTGIVQFPSTYLWICLLGFFPYRVAQIVWLLMQFIFSTLMFFSIKKVFFKKTGRLDYLIFCFLTISGAPYRTNLSNLQYSLCAFSLFMLALYLIENGHEYWAGIALSFALFKVQMIVPLLLVMLYLRKFKPFVTLFISQLIALVFSAFWFGDLYKITFGCLNSVSDFYEGAGGFIDLGVMVPNSILHMLFVATLFCAAIFISFSNKYNGDNDEYLLYFSWLIMFMLIVVYHRSYDYFMMAIPLVWSIRFCSKESSKGHIILVVLFAVLVGDLYWIASISDIVSTYIARVVYYMSFIGITTVILKKLMTTPKCLKES